ncbi:hypothetical protein ACJJWD_14485 [Comamonas testosteroni]|uniref:hypothetical protein n=1 Tax=Comamonas testosteroni TaxID=285 RepID=UPI00389A80DD
MINITLFGTSRLHRPFCKKTKAGDIIDNIQEGINVNFPKVGYFHTAAEILQVIQWIKGVKDIPLDLRKYVFRIEPRPTTPRNEFDKNLEDSIKNDQQYETKDFLEDTDVVVIEVSSLKENFHSETSTYFHTNPNFSMNLTYKDIGAEGVYKKFFPDLGVSSVNCNEDNLLIQLHKIREEIYPAKLVVMGHIRSDTISIPLRDKIHDILLRINCDSGIFYFDNSEFLDKYGWASDPSGGVDKNHLSYEGETAIGIALQKFVKNII